MNAPDPHIPAQRPAPLGAPRPESQAPVAIGAARVSYFVRLKLRIMRNSLRPGRRHGDDQKMRVFSRYGRLILFIFGLVMGLWAAVLGFAAFAGSSLADPELRAPLATFAGTAVVLAWIFVPLLFFGVDETLDPARFALLPVPRRTLVLGMLAAAFVGIPPMVTLLATLGSTIGAAFDGGPAAALVAVAGAFIGIALCVAASRAVTSAFARMLRSRRVRDLAALLIALLGISCNPVFQLVFAVVQHGESKQSATIGEVLSWTPLAAPYVAYLDAIDGDWALVAARLLIGVAGVVVLLWWWLHTIESAMLGVSDGPGARKGVVTDPPVRAFVPRLLRFVPTGRFAGLLAREVRYWLRDPRRRASLISLLAASIVIPFAFTFGSGGPGSQGFSGGAFVYSLLFAGAFVGLVLVNQFGNDGTAYALHMLTNVPGQVELTARALGVGVLTFPLLAVGTIVVSVVSGNAAQLPAALGVGLCAFGISVGAAGITSVLAPYPMPDTSNPFAMNTGRGSVKSLLSFVSMLATWLLTAPLLLAFTFLPDHLTWLLLPVGVAWGLALGWIGTRVAGALLERRAPEVLAAVTPKRA
ncbi:ABC transporter permease [Dactylosporangium sp. AC04546]|uniref:ABC transporter permease n=1 Tax=Dactylosporangium sp. AC04546 TaxID=2862460 RepID=UPI001EDF79B5|nr:ABC transporter permease [Dactylosporangium sp. AC04546]WVK83769.1 ABC transporter permease [Dactylosporangium sp. AC04546]